MDFYGTIGPACADAVLLQQMVEAGMTGIRMNLSHGPLAAHKDWLALLRKAGVKKLLIDLQGPELRIGRLPQPLSLTAGQTVRLGAQGIPCPAALVDEVVIARGDLGNAMPLWELPRCQKQLSAACRAAGVPFMVVTQMLDSMHTRAVPTRAEVNDIYNAVLDGASSLMLTGETAAGQYPVQAMEYLVRTARTAM